MSQSQSRADNSLHIGGVPLSEKSLAQHILIGGSTGTGKSVAIDQLLVTVRARGDMAVIIDPGGGFLSRHYQPGDAILNPLDADTVNWSSFAEIVNDEDFEDLAASLIPQGEGEGATWNGYARDLFADIMRGMMARGEQSPHRLYDYLVRAKNNQLDTILANTSSSILLDAANAKLLGNVRGVAKPFAKILQKLEPQGANFSVRKFIKKAEIVEPGKRHPWLFITYQDNQMRLMRQLVAAFADQAILQALSLTENPARRLFFVLDELDSVGHLSQLKDGMVKLRKRGGCCVLAVQTKAQLRAVYGPDISIAIKSNAATKLILRSGDAETAKEWSDEIGEEEIERAVRSVTETTSDSGGLGLFNGKNPSGWSKTHTEATNFQPVRQAAVMPAELLRIPDLKGYLLRPGEHPAIVTLKYQPMPTIRPTFVPKFKGVNIDDAA